MAVLVRLFNFIPNTLIQSGQVNPEFNQLVDILAGNSTTKNAVMQFNDAAIPVLELNQLGAGLITRWKQNGVEKAHIKNDGSLMTGGAATYDINSNQLIGLSPIASAVNRINVQN